MEPLEQWRQLLKLNRQVARDFATDHGLDHQQLLRELIKVKAKTQLQRRLLDHFRETVEAYGLALDLNHPLLDRLFPTRRGVVVRSTPYSDGSRTFQNGGLMRRIQIGLDVLDYAERRNALARAVLADWEEDP